MRTILVSLFFVTHLHAGIIADSFSTSTTSVLNGLDNVNSTSLFDEDDELTKISATCLSPSDYAEFTGNIVAPLLTRMLAVYLNSETVPIIGLSELRAALNFAPLRPWVHYNRTEPREEELASAPSIEAYYDLKEPRSETRSLDSISLLEKNMPPAIAFFDKRFPSIRSIFRRRFEEIRRSEPGVVDRKTIDLMLDEFRAIRGRVNSATDVVFGPRYRSGCRDD